MVVVNKLESGCPVHIARTAQESWGFNVHKEVKSEVVVNFSKMSYCCSIS